MLVRCTWVCWRCTLKLISYEKKKKLLNYMEHPLCERILTACVIESPVNVTTHFNCSGGVVNINLSCFFPSLLYNGTGKRWAHSCQTHKKFKNVTKMKSYDFYIYTHTHIHAHTYVCKDIDYFSKCFLKLQKIMIRTTNIEWILRSSLWTCFRSIQTNSAF